MITKQKSVLTAISAWGALGFMRGIQSYNFETPLTNMLYTDKFISGLAGLAIYINPMTGLFMVYKELYRIEVNIFNIRREKESNFYNKLLF
jgi:hypothetical protein